MDLPKSITTGLWQLHFPAGAFLCGIIGKNDASILGQVGKKTGSFPVHTITLVESFEKTRVPSTAGSCLHTCSPKTCFVENCFS